jgi:RNA polymerase-binding transcription factor
VRTAVQLGKLKQEEGDVAITKTVVEAIPTEELEGLRQALIDKRLQVMNLYRQDVQAGQESTDDNADDFADRANNSYSRETMFALSDAERSLMFAIDEALARFEKGTFGQCDNCGNQIGLPRLRAIAWARYCIDCQELNEKGLLD